MDQARRILLALLAIPTIGLLLSVVCWVGYRIGGDLRNEPTAACSVRPSAPTSEVARPGLLPKSEVVRCVTRLNVPEDEADPPGVPSEWVATAGSNADREVSEQASEPDRELSLDGPDLGCPTSVLGDVTEPATADHEPAPPSTAPAGPIEAPTRVPSVRPMVQSDLIGVPRATPWATPYRPGERSPQLEQMAQQADQHTRHGFELASNQAFHSARAEFIRALRVVAQGLDSEHGCQIHSQALSAGLKALDEANDFVPVGSSLEGDLDLAAIIMGHDTRELKLVDHRRLTPLRAVQSYVDCARQHLAVAAGGEVAGSMALHALGKLHRSLAEQQGANQPIAATKALAFLEASVQVCPRNHLAFNDLGVLLAHGGRYADAGAAFERSQAIAPSATTMRNLAQVHRRMGDLRRAEMAEREANALVAAQGRPAGNPSRPAPTVAWVSPQVFAQSYAKAAGPWQPAPANREGPRVTPAGAPSAAPAVPVEQASRGWLGDAFKKHRQ